MESAIKAFALAVTGGMVWSGARFFNTVKYTELLNEGTFKVAALIRMDTGRNAKLIEPLRDQSLSNNWGSLISGRNSQGVFTENVCHD